MNYTKGSCQFSTRRSASRCIFFFISRNQERNGEKPKNPQLIPPSVPQRGKRTSATQAHFSITDAQALRRTTQKLSFCIILRIEKRFMFRRVQLPLLSIPLAWSFASRRRITRHKSAADQCAFAPYKMVQVFAQFAYGYKVARLRSTITVLTSLSKIFP